MRPCSYACSTLPTRLLVVGEHRFLLRRDDHVVLRDRHTGARRVAEAELLDRVEHRRHRVRAVLVDEARDEVVELPLRHRAVDVVVIRRELALELADRLAQRPVDLRVEDHAARGGEDELALPQVLDRLLQVDLLRVERELDVLLGPEALRPRVEGVGRQLVEVLVRVREVVRPEHHVLRRRRERAAGGRREDVVGGEHEDARLRLGLRRQRHVHRHLVAVEVRVERVADERVDLDRLALDEHRLERLDAEAVERRGAVEQHRVLLDDLLEDVPDLGLHLVDVPLGRLDVLDDLPLDEPAHDERLEELERHELRQPALVELQVRPGDDDRAARVVDALAEQVLAEPALLALEHVRDRLERAVARPGDRAAAPAVVEQRVDGLLEHPLLVVDDDLGRAEVEQPLEAVVPVDDAPVQVVEVRRREAAAVELDHRAQLRRDHRHCLEDHPLGAVLGREERRDDLQPLDRALLLLPLRGADRLAQARGLGLEVEVLEQVADRLRAHAAAEVHAEPVRRSEAVLELAEDLLVVDDELRLELAEELPRLLQPAHGVDGGLARVLAARLDVEVHLAHLQRPLDDRVQVLLLDAAVRAQAQVVRQLADVAVRLRRVEHVGEQPLAEVARLLEILEVDARGERSILLVQLVAGEQAVDDAVEVLRDRTLLRAGRLRELLLEWGDRREDLLGGGRDLVELARRQPAVVADRRVADELADLLRVLGRDLPDELDEEAARRDCARPRESGAPAPRPSSRARGPRSRRPRRSSARGPSRSSRAGVRAGPRARRAPRRGRRRSARTPPSPGPRGRSGRRRASRCRPR